MLQGLENGKGDAVYSEERLEKDEVWGVKMKNVWKGMRVCRMEVYCEVGKG